MAELHTKEGLKEQSLIASVLFAEIAGYADRPVFQQIQYTTRMRQLLEHSIAQAASRDVVSFDREENVVVLFASDPMACFRLAKQLSDILAADESYRDLPLHVGVNLGPVTLSKNELNVAQVNGVGVEDAARVARAGLLREVLISRAYYTVFARISKDYTLLQYREFLSDDFDEWFAIYQIAPPSSSPETHPISNPSARDARAPFAGRTVRWRYAAMSAVIAIAAFATYQNQRSEMPQTDHPLKVVTTKTKDTPRREAQSIQAANIVAVVPIPSPAHAAAPSEPAMEADVDTAKIVAAVNFHHAIRSSEPSASSARRSKPAKHFAASPIIKPATLRLAIKPWGEVYVDGKKVGVTPPLHKIKVPAGKRQIVVRNRNFLPYHATIEIQPDSLLQISHRFDRK
ncbi:MAG: PEGA domain-containing protein [Pseudomonadota bacterium]|nr:PEGA domain-containing protein [Pseudomonadota bacterium]